MKTKEQTQLEKLIYFVDYYATCPCCQQSDICLEECTFAEDSPADFDVMQVAREALQ